MSSNIQNLKHIRGRRQPFPCAHSGGIEYWTRVQVSMGRVQGPTLAFLVERESEIGGFVPLPFWKVLRTFEKSGWVAIYSEFEKQGRNQIVSGGS